MATGTVRHERDKLDRLMTTCSRCGEWCEADNGQGGGAFFDWCKTCGRRLCGGCITKGCCGCVPMKSGFDEMMKQPVIYGPEMRLTNSINIPREQVKP